MSDAADQLRVLLSIKGKSITIRRGEASVTLEAVRGATTGKLIGGGGSFTSFRTDDWLIVSSDTGTFGRPKVDDVIECEAKRYLIGHPDNKTQAVNSRDEDELTLRIHSVRDQL